MCQMRCPQNTREWVDPEHNSFQSAACTRKKTRGGRQSLSRSVGLDAPLAPAWPGDDTFSRSQYRGITRGINSSGSRAFREKRPVTRRRKPDRMRDSREEAVGDP